MNKKHRFPLAEAKYRAATVPEIAPHPGSSRKAASYLIEQCCLKPGRTLRNMLIPAEQIGSLVRTASVGEVCA
ncbi:MAG: hypothetical protein EOP84_28195 [Verrucomicrobiaceae bacterium]|nr:MAG: hypothetical protein EOP84_28195 [Verrucomicrobiaceae bacterium]